jgi:hypothetical protein
MRSMMIVAACLLFATHHAEAQYARADSTSVFATEPSAADSTRLPAEFTIRYPVAKHALYGSATGAAIAGSFAGIVSVVCASPSCPRLGPAITYGSVFGLLVGAALGAVSGVNTPLRVLRPQ